MQHGRKRYGCFTPLSVISGISGNNMSAKYVTCLPSSCERDSRTMLSDGRRIVNSAKRFLGRAREDLYETETTSPGWCDITDIVKAPNAVDGLASRIAVAVAGNPHSLLGTPNRDLVYLPCLYFCKERSEPSPLYVHNNTWILPDVCCYMTSG